MSNFEIILDKLNGFTKKYYSQLLLKGLVLFFSFGVLIFLLITGIEYFLWLNKTGRLILLLLLLLTEALLLYYWVITPILYLFRVKRGLNHDEASVLIGKHFSSVSDKLRNLLDLSKNKEKSELLLAAIDSRAVELQPVAFSKAIEFKEVYRYLKFAAIPLLILAVLWISGSSTSFFESIDRVRNYDLAYAPPAPFEFELLNEKLTFLESDEITVKMKTTGKVIPESAILVYNGTSYVMEKTAEGFVHRFERTPKSGFFHFMANGFNSRDFKLAIDEVPVIKDFELSLQYPNYLNRQNEIIRGTGNAAVPEGTRAIWQVKADKTDRISFNVAGDSIQNFMLEENIFVFEKQLFNSLQYAVSTSNANVSDFESLGFRIDVIKDGYPNLKVVQKLDSLQPNKAYYSGGATDDYGVREIRLVYAPIDNKQEEKRVVMVSGNSSASSFQYEFPTGLEIDPGKGYQLYFEAVDNDALRNGKVTKSQVFTINTYDGNELKNKELESYKSVLDQFQGGMKKLEEQEESLEEINKTQKEKEQLNFDDKQEIKQFLDKQKRQEELMEKFSKELNKGIESDELDDRMKELLKERLERQEEEAKKNQKLLEELEKIAEKIEKDELQQRLEELAKNQNSNKRNLEQLLELTKRYYVTEKAGQLSEELSKLSERQQTLSDINMDEQFNKTMQEKLNDKYEELDQQIDELEKDNQDLKKPLDLDIDQGLQDGVKKDQEEALEEIGKHQGDEQSSDGQKIDSKNAVKKNMRGAANKMKELSKALQQGASMSGGGGSTITEDAEMLRQILDNLITFSFKQESLFDKISESQGDLDNVQSKVIKDQQELRRLFEHVDDSLFALSMRRAELSEFVNDQIVEVFYNIDKSLDNIAENQLFQGASYQQYVLSASNELADFLANLLDNMQESMMSGQGQGQGEGQGFQLPDIIKEQQGLGEQMGKMSGKGKQGENGQGKENGQGGENGKDEGGKSEGNNGEAGSQGQEGEKGSKGEGGKSGPKGDGKNGNNEGGNGRMGPSEQELQEIYQIYKEQQVIRQKLEEQLENIINNEDRELAKKLVLQMEQFENDLIENGITQRTINRMNTIQHQLLKLENAAIKQGQKKERESKTNTKTYTSPKQGTADESPDKQPRIEILNRDALPLQQNYKRKVKRYFERNDQF